MRDSLNEHEIACRSKDYCDQCNEIKGEEHGNDKVDTLSEHSQMAYDSRAVNFDLIRNSQGGTTSYEKIEKELCEMGIEVRELEFQMTIMDQKRTEDAARSPYDLWILDMDERGKEIKLIQTNFIECEAIDEDKLKLRNENIKRELYEIRLGHSTDRSTLDEISNLVLELEKQLSSSKEAARDLKFSLELNGADMVDFAKKLIETEQKIEKTRSENESTIFQELEPVHEIYLRQHNECATYNTELRKLYDIYGLECEQVLESFERVMSQSTAMVSYHALIPDSQITLELALSKRRTHQTLSKYLQFLNGPRAIYELKRNMHNVTWEEMHAPKF